MRQLFAVVCAGLVWFSGCGSSSGVYTASGDGQAEITVRRAESPVNAGFKERIFIDGVERLTLNNGGVATIKVPNGNHIIHAELHTMTTSRLEFIANWDPLTFIVTAGSVKDFTIAQAQGAAAGQRYVGGIEGALNRAAESAVKNISREKGGLKIAIVSITAEDRSSTEFIAGELEYLWVEMGFAIVDRSELEKIKDEQQLQLGSDFDQDNVAASLGKLAGANIVVTGRIDGEGSLRRLRLRVLDAQTGQVIGAASERL